MILFQGKVYKNQNLREIYPKMKHKILSTLSQPTLTSDKVINACDLFALKLEKGEYDSILHSMLTDEQKNTVVSMLRKETLEQKMLTELGFMLGDKDKVHGNGKIIVPLGVLFHIAAGNMEGIPAYSVVEGLLACNINILKLPSVDHGTTVTLLQELIRLEPDLKDYIYVVDTPSYDLASLKLLETLSDAVVVWGSDATIRAVRNTADANTRLIEWGHKISFVYITEAKLETFDYQQLATHIVKSKQLLCNSCQGVFIDTQKEEVLVKFAKKLLPVLEKACNKECITEGVRGKISLQLYTDDLMKIIRGEDERILRGTNCSIRIGKDSSLTSSFTHGNLWVKMLPKERLVKQLHQYKSHLQTVGLECKDEEYITLRNIFVHAGVTRITNVKDMLSYHRNAPHDGYYPLQRYTKVVELHQ